MSARLVGVDVGARAVRVVEVRGIDAKGFAIVSRLAVVPLRQDAVINGRIRNHVVVSQALQRALRQAGVPRYGFVIGLSAPDVAVARVTQPAVVKPAERAKALRNTGVEISSNVPLADAVVATNLIGTDVTADGHAMNNLVVVAALNEAVESVQQVMRLARCQPRAIDVTGAALMRSLVRTRPDSKEVHTVVDVGASSTTIVTRAGLHLRSIRVLAVGGDNLTRAVASASGEDWETAEQRLGYLRLASAPAAAPVKLASGYGHEDDAPSITVDQRTQIDEAVLNAAEDLIEQVARVIESDASTHGNTFAQGIVLCGGGAQLSGFKERLHQRIGVPVQLGRPWAVLEKSKANLVHFKDGAEDPRLMTQLTAAIGLAQWKEPR